MKYCQIMNYALQSAYSGRGCGGARELGEQISLSKRLSREDLGGRRNDSDEGIVVWWRNRAIDCWYLEKC